jgi:hypothetical protein
LDKLEWMRFETFFCWCDTGDNRTGIKVEMPLVMGRQHHIEIDLTPLWECSLNVGWHDPSHGVGREIVIGVAQQSTCGECATDVETLRAKFLLRIGACSSIADTVVGGDVVSTTRALQVAVGVHRRTPEGSNEEEDLGREVHDRTLLAVNELCFRLQCAKIVRTWN